MKQLTAEDAQPLNARLRAVHHETVLGFPKTQDNSLIEVRAFSNITDDVLAALDNAARTAIDEGLVERFPGANWPTGFSGKRTVGDWHTLREYSYPHGTDKEWDSPVLRDGRQERFAAQFNALMDRADDEGWLLGFGWLVDDLPPGDFAEELPTAEFQRILVPTEPGTTGLREIIGAGDGAEQALNHAIESLGMLGITGATDE